MRVLQITKAQKKNMTTKSGAQHNSSDNENRVVSAEKRFINILFNSATTNEYLMNALNMWVLPENDLAKE